MTKKTIKTGKELEQQVADAYRQMGARKVEHDVELAGNQIDVYVELETPGRLLHRIAVEAKDWTTPVGIKVVNGFAHIVDLLRRERLIDEGVIVSASGFSKQARNAAQTYGIQLLEAADLEMMVAEARERQMTEDERVEKALAPLPSSLPSPVSSPREYVPVIRSQMTSMEFLDFELRLELWEEGKGYPVSASGPAGNALRDFLILDENRLSLSKSKIEGAILRRGPTRRVSPEIQLAQTVGTELFDALPRSMKENYWRSLSMAEQTGKGLRFKLCIDPKATGLLGLPWELLYDPERSDFLALSKKTPVVRYIPLPRPLKPLQIQPPFRILVLIASPEDSPVPGLQEERRRIHKALSPLKRNQLVNYKIVEGPDTFAKLRSHLRRTEFHALHFIGHGEFDEEAEEGVLLFEDSVGVSRPVTGDRIKVIIGDEPSIRLVFLNACEGAQLAETDAFTGVAMGLVRAGIPAVVAMQFEITGDAAVWFSSEFYKALADGYPVDAAVSEGRKAIYSEMGSVEWATPTLYMRASDGVLFNIQTPLARVRELPTLAGEPEPEEISEKTLVLQIPGLEGLEVAIYLTGPMSNWTADPALRYQQTDTPGIFSLTARLRAGEVFKHYVLSNFADRARVAACLRRAGYIVTGKGDASLEHPDKWRTWFLLRYEDGFSVRGDGVFAENVW